MALSVGSHDSHFYSSYSNFGKWCWGDRSHTSSAPIIRWQTTRLVPSPYFPLVASVPRGTLALEESAPEVWEALGANGVLLGAISVEVDGAGSQPHDDSGGLVRDWVMRGAGIGAPGSTALSDAIPALGSSGAVGPGVSWLLLPGYSQVLPVCIMALLAGGRTFENEKRVYVKRMLGIEVPYLIYVPRVELHRAIDLLGLLH
jgi:hypothetical protein